VERLGRVSSRRLLAHVAGEPVTSGARIGDAEPRQIRPHAPAWAAPR
jgi:hypothetical protein